jgi:hypothetical protein
MTDRPAYVYALAEPGALTPCASVVRYIGKSIDPKHRFRGHVNYSRYTRTTRLACWVYSVSPLVPTLFILSKHENEEAAYAAEMEWIAHYKARGASLCNNTDGGEGARGLVFSEAAIAKLSAAARKYAADPEWHKKISEGTKRGKAAMSVEATAMWKENLKKSLADPEIRRRMGASRGKKRSPESVAKTATAHRGMKRSQETCAAISMAKRGKAWSPEMRAAMTEGERYCDICGDGPFRGGRGVGNHKRTHARAESDVQC